MRTKSRTVPRTALDAAEREGWLYRHALTLALTQTPVAGETVREAPGLRYRYRLTLYAPCASHGGVVIERFIAPGQADSVSAVYLDDLRARWQGVSSAVGGAFRVAIEALVEARERAWFARAPRRDAVCPGRSEGLGHAERENGTCAFCYEAV